MNNSASRYKWHANHRLTDCKLEVTYRKNSLCTSTLHDGNYGGMTTHQYWSTFRANCHWTVLLPGVKSTYLTNCSLSMNTIYNLCLP